MGGTWEGENGLPPTLFHFANQRKTVTYLSFILHYYNNGRMGGYI
jgi:hypothetical protein